MNISRLLLYVFCLLISTRSYAGSGEISIYVFLDGSAKANQKLLIDGKYELESDVSGQSRVSSDAGVHFISVFYEQNEFVSSEFRVFDGLDTRIYVNLSEDKAPLFSIDEPEARKPVESQNTNEQTLSFKGKVISLTDESPVAGVNIYLKASSQSAMSNDSGEFSIEIPVSKPSSLSFIHPKFASLTVDNIQISESENFRLFRLSPAGIRLEEFVVTAPHIKGSVASLLDERRSASEVSDVIGSEQMSKSGDSDAASALRRVTGLTLVDGRYVYIRGLGGRYSSVLLNGFHLPSTNPLRREVPLDMFPTGVLESIVVKKSYSSDLPGDFGGGSVLLKSKSIPEEFFFKSSVSYTKSDLDDKGWTYTAGERDWLGYDDGKRALPDLVVKSIPKNQRLKRKTLIDQSGLDDTQIEALGESFENRWNLKEKKVPASLGISLSTGSSLKFGNSSLGFLASGLYGNDWDNEKKLKKGFIKSAEGFEQARNATQEETENLIKLGGSLSLGLDLWQKHSIRSFSALLRRTTNKAQYESGFNGEYDGDYRVYGLEWNERQLVLNQLWGEHQLWWDSALSWRFGVTSARQYQPDTRQYRYQQSAGVWRLASRNDGNERRFGELDESSTSMGVDYEIPFALLEQKFSLKLGSEKISRERQSSLRRFGFIIQNLSSEILSQSMEDIFQKENIEASKLRLNEKTLATDSYSAEQEISASYVSAQLDLLNTLELSLGLRKESSEQKVTTYDFENPNEAIRASLANDQALPSVNSTLSFSDKLQLRFGYAKTLARPDFRELSSSEYIDEETGRVAYGNPDLETTVITSYDTRLEFYPSSFESLSLGFFKKDFLNPIEVANKTGGRQTFRNADSADLFGAEVDILLGLSRIHDSLEDFKVSANYAYIFSEVSLKRSQTSGEASDIFTSEKRAMQGQSPYIVNLAVYYDNLSTDTNFALLWNRFGDRISGIGELGTPDEYEQERDQLDFVFSQELNDHMGVSLKLKNILDSKQVFKEEDRTTFERKLGREYSLGFSAKF